MIHVFIKPVTRTHYKFEDVLDFELQNIAEAKRLIIQSLLENPLKSRPCQLKVMMMRWRDKEIEVFNENRL